MLALDILRARKGDCLIVRYGSDGDEKLILVDGGPSRVFRRFLKPRLQAIRSERELDTNESLEIELLMVSHIDDDHVKGILDLTKELIRDADASRPQTVTINALWHNTFNDIIGDTPDELEASITAGFGEASLAGAMTSDDRLSVDAKKLLASVNQGRKLRDAAERLNWSVNPQFGGKLVLARGEPNDKITLPSGLSLHVLGPMREEIEALQAKHDRYLQREGLGRRDPEAALAAFSDRSVANLSSLVVIAEMDGRTLLLTGDARGDKILEGMELQGRLTPGGTAHVDVLKVPHHGSDRNVTTKFFRRITADHYVFCGDGEHGNPERETAEMLFEARPAGDFTLHFSYDLDEIDEERRMDHLKKHTTWTPSNHALEDFLKQQKDAGVPFEIREPGDHDSLLLDLG